MASYKRIVVLEANPAAEVFGNKPGHGDWFVKALGQVDPRGRGEVYNLPWGAWPEKISGVDGLIVTGSSKEVYDNEAWMGQAEELVREARRKGIPALGVCFGHQLIAQAFGGRVIGNPKGREIGTCEVKLVGELTDKDDLVDGLPENLKVQQSHKSVVSKLPEGGVVLAGNDFGVQAFRLGEDKVWGVQFHPEVTAETLRKVVKFRKKVLAEEGLSAEKICEQIEDTVEARRILTNFIKVVYES